MLVRVLVILQNNSAKPYLLSLYCDLPPQTWSVFNFIVLKCVKLCQLPEVCVGTVWYDMSFSQNLMFPWPWYFDKHVSPKFFSDFLHTVASTFLDHFSILLLVLVTFESVLVVSYVMEWNPWYLIQDGGYSEIIWNNLAYGGCTHITIEHLSKQYCLFFFFFMANNMHKDNAQVVSKFLTQEFWV